MTPSACKQCHQNFEVTDDDRAFYERVSPIIKEISYRIPPPQRCPECRQQRRLAFRNERNLYRRTCDSCKKSMVALFPPNSPFVVYCQECIWSDHWDPLAYGKKFDFNRPFFEQFQELQREVPRAALFNLNSTNSEYTNHSADNKNCYMGVAFGNCEDCLYGHWVVQCKDCVDNLYVERCQLCYECSYCIDCYQTAYSQYCEQMKDSYLCFECKESEYCIGCVQLHHQKYYILNEKVSPEAFAEAREKLLTDRAYFENMTDKFEELKRQSPRRASRQINCDNSSGNDLYNCKNAINSFNCRNLEDCKYMFDLGNNRDSMDCYEHGWLVQSELAYESHAGMSGYRFRFCNMCAHGNDLTCCDCCINNCAHLFGCIGLKKKTYCVFNMQYTQQEYEELVPRIIAHMIKTNEWGEFFPAHLSPYGYNESAASEYYPLAKEMAQQQGFNWQDYEAPVPQADHVIGAEQMPYDIRLVSDEIVTWVIEGEGNKKRFKITPQELKFYRQHRIPIPRQHPDDRHRRRMKLRPPRKLWKRTCHDCTQPIETVFSPEQPERVLCEECYLKAVY